MERSVARLFQDRGAVLAEVELSQASILGGATCPSCTIPALQPHGCLPGSHTDSLVWCAANLGCHPLVHGSIAPYLSPIF